MRLVNESISDLPIYIEEDILEEMERRGTDRLSLEDATDLIGLNPYFKTATNHTIRYLILSYEDVYYDLNISNENGTYYLYRYDLIDDEDSEEDGLVWDARTRTWRQPRMTTGKSRNRLRLQENKIKKLIKESLLKESFKNLVIDIEDEVHNEMDRRGTDSIPLGLGVYLVSRLNLFKGMSYHDIRQEILSLVDYYHDLDVVKRSGVMFLERYSDYFPGSPEPPRYWENRIRKPIKESIIAAMEPGNAKAAAVDLMDRLDRKMENDPNFQPYYDKLHELYKDIVSGEYFSYLMSDDVWAGGEQAISLIESLLMAMPEDQEYQSILRDLNAMYDVFYRSEDEGYGEYYDRQRLMAAAQHGHLMHDFLSGNLEKLASENPYYIEEYGKDAAENPSKYDDYMYKELKSYANELGILLDSLIVIPMEVDAVGVSSKNHLYDQIIAETRANKTKRFTEHSLEILKPKSPVYITRHHAQTEKGILPFLIVSEHGYANIFLPASFEAMTYSQSI